jgi:hypothetical protein
MSSARFSHGILGDPALGIPRLALVRFWSGYTVSDLICDCGIILSLSIHWQGMARGFWAWLAWFASQALDDHYERIADVDVRAS